MSKKFCTACNEEKDVVNSSLIDKGVKSKIYNIQYSSVWNKAFYLKIIKDKFRISLIMYIYNHL